MNHKYRKKTVAPLYLYNIFNQLYFKYFEGHPIRGAKRLPSSEMESYLTWFITTHYPKVKNQLKDYIIWCFQQHGRFRIKLLHRFIDSYDGTKPSAEIQPFANKIAKYMRDNYISSWEAYIAPRPNFFPIIFQHYVASKDFPFEVLLHLGIFDSIPASRKDMAKAMLRTEFYEIDQHTKKAEKHRVFIGLELDRIKNLI